MDLSLVRNRFTANGVFGNLFELDGNFGLSTLEHSFNGKPILPEGEFYCRRGMHQLMHMHAPFETFEIMGVPGHSGVLFHVGNFQSDSEGCILLGLTAIDTMILNSREAFKKFMDAQDGVKEFQLLVSSAIPPQASSAP